MYEGIRTRIYKKQSKNFKTRKNSLKISLKTEILTVIISRLCYDKLCRRDQY